MKLDAALALLPLLGSIATAGVLPPQETLDSLYASPSSSSSTDAGIDLAATPTTDEAAVFTIATAPALDALYVQHGDPHAESLPPYPAEFEATTAADEEHVLNLEKRDPESQLISILTVTTATTSSAAWTATATATVTITYAADLAPAPTDVAAAITVPAHATSDATAPAASSPASASSSDADAEAAVEKRDLVPSPHISTLIITTATSAAFYTATATITATVTFLPILPPPAATDAPSTINSPSNSSTPSTAPVQAEKRDASFLSVLSEDYHKLNDTVSSAVASARTGVSEELDSLKNSTVAVAVGKGGAGVIARSIPVPVITAAVMILAMTILTFVGPEYTRFRDSHGTQYGKEKITGYLLAPGKGEGKDKDKDKGRIRLQEADDKEPDEKATRGWEMEMETDSWGRL